MDNPSIKIRRNENPGATFVPNEFIDHYMAKAPGEYVKVYLYLLRCLYDREACFSFTDAACRLDSSESDIRRAISFWENTGLLSLERSTDGITGIFLCPEENTCRTRGTGTVSAGEAASQNRCTRIPDYPAGTLHAFCSEPDVSQTVFVIEQYLGRQMTCHELSCLYEWANCLSFSPDLIIALIEQCISDGCHDITVMHRKALEWNQAGIRTPAQALSFTRTEKEAGSIEMLCRKVCSALGISGRTLSTSEREYILKWSEEWQFSEEMILEACRRTIANTHRASFEYTQTILKNWLRAGIADPEAARAADASYHSRKEASSRKNSENRRSTPRRSKYGELELLTMANI